MNFQSRGIQMSFAVHTVIFALFFFLGGTAMKDQRTIVIDFSVVSAPDGSAELTHENSRELQTQHRITDIRQATRTAETKETDLPQHKEEVVAPSLSEDQVTVAPSFSENRELAVPYPDPVQGVTDKDLSEEHPAFHKNERTTDDIASGGTSRGEGTYVSDYLMKNFSYIQDIIQRNIAYPVIARQRGWEGRVTVSFVVCIDGRVKNIILEKASGIGLLDRNAVETVRKTSPFPRPPLEAKVVVPIVYTLH